MVELVEEGWLSNMSVKKRWSNGVLWSNDVLLTVNTVSHNPAQSSSDNILS